MGIFSMLGNILGFGSNFLKKNLSSYNFLETTDGETLIAKDGSFATVVRIDGIRKLMGEVELNELVRQATTRWSVYLSRPGHAIQIWFSRDPDLSGDLIKTMMVPPRTVARRLGLDLEDLFVERESHLPNFIVPEAFYMVLWTRLTILSKQELSKAKALNKQPKFWPNMADSQWLFKGSRQLMGRHRSFVSSFLQDLNGFGIRAEALDAHASIKAIKASIYPDLVGAGWKPFLPGDLGKGINKNERGPWPRLPENGAGDMSHLLWPKLDDQIFDRDAEVINQHVVRVGRYYFSGTDMTLGPLDILPFSSLINRLTEVDEFPWRISYLIEGDGLPGLAVKNFLASVASFTNSENKMIREAVKLLGQYKADGQCLVRMRISLATWAPSDNLALIEERANKLQRAVETWGYCQVSPSAGDPLSGTMSSAMGIDARSTATPGVPPLNEAIYMMPWMRDASPFTRGSVLFRTPDGRPWPFQPGSSQQDTFIDIIYATPGKGKSVYLNTTNLAFCLSPLATQGTGGAMLPRIAIIDIGPSSSGLISLIKESLPPDRRHEVEYRRLRMIKEHAINPFDLQLGSRAPLPLERDFLVNFLTVLGTPVGESVPPSNLSDLAGLAVDEVYKKYSDKSRNGEPRPYTDGEDAEVDAALARWEIELEEKPTWYEVVDKLFAKGGRDLIRIAGLAQRHAVPLIHDIMGILREPQITDIYGEAKTDNGSLLISVFYMMLSSSQREYPILTCPTRLDFGGARVVSLDLDEAAPRGGPSADKQASIVYMLARFVLAKDFYLNPEIINLFEPDYKSYHESRIQRIRETPKRLVMDEFHRTSSSPNVRTQVKIDMREGRKWAVQVVLSSQLIDDFDNDMISLTSGFWIMGVNSEKDARKAQQTFGLSEAATDIVINRLRGPSPEGAPFLAVLQMKDGMHEHLLYNTLGPMEMWAFSTTAADSSLRNRLYSRIGPLETRKRLARRFPNGSAVPEITRRAIDSTERGSSDVNLNEGFIDQIANEIERMQMN